MMEFLFGFIVGALLHACLGDWRRAAIEADRDYFRWLAANRQARIELMDRQPVKFSRN
jgi:hypothetical protein